MKRPEEPQASILGWNTRIDDGKEVPWFAMYTKRTYEPPALRDEEGGGKVRRTVWGQPQTASSDDSAEKGRRIPTPWYTPLPQNPAFDWRNSPPRMPTYLISPFEHDENLNLTRGALKRQCHQSGFRWFRRGPYEVMLEDLLRKKLREIGG